MPQTLINQDLLVSGTINATVGTFIDSLTVSGIPVNIGTVSTIDDINSISTGSITIDGADGNTVLTVGQVITVSGHRDEFVTASGFLQDQIVDASSDVSSVNAITGAVLIAGSDGLTIDNTSQTVTVQGFYTEFVNASGTLDSQIDSDIVTHAAIPSAHHEKYTDAEAISALEPTTSALAASGVATDANIVSVSGHLQGEIDAVGPSPVTLQEAYDNGDGTITTDTIIGPFEVTGSGIFTGDLTVNTDTLYVDSANGRVGVGTTNPNVELEVRGDAIFDNNDDSANSIAIDSGSSSANRSVLVFRDRGTAIWSWRKDTDNDFKLISEISPNPIPITVESAGSAAQTNALTIDSGGFVGLGTITPTQKLQVLGSGIVEGKLTVGSSSTLGADDLHVFSDDSGGAQFRLEGDDEDYIRMNSGGSGFLATQILTSRPSLRVVISGTSGPATSTAVRFETLSTRLFNDDREVVRIQNDRLGIRTTGPTEALHVVGSGIFTGGVTVSGLPVHVSTGFNNPAALPQMGSVYLEAPVAGDQIMLFYVDSAQGSAIFERTTAVISGTIAASGIPYVDWNIQAGGTFGNSTEEVFSTAKTTTNDTTGDTFTSFDEDTIGQGNDRWCWLQIVEASGVDTFMMSAWNRITI